MTTAMAIYLAAGVALAVWAKPPVPIRPWYSDALGFVVVAIVWLPVIAGVTVHHLLEKRRG